jgi:hypothetical protein
MEKAKANVKEMSCDELFKKMKENGVNPRAASTVLGR